MFKLLSVLLFCAIQVVFGSKTAEQTSDLTFGVFSDVHSNTKYFDRALDNIFTLTNNGEELDGVIMVGDIIHTNANQTPSYDFVTSNKQFQRLASGGKIIAAMGNHEFPLKASDSKTTEQAKKLFEENMGVPVQNDAVYNGYHFITVGSDTYFGELSVFQERWAMDRINAALDESEDKPVFLLIHHPVDNTIYGSFDKNRHSKLFEDFIKSQPRLVVISGHNHYTESDPHSIYQVKGGATFIYTSVVHTTAEQAMEYATAPHDTFSSQGLILKINGKTNVVTVKRFYVDEKEPTYLEGGDWVIDIPEMVKESRENKVSTRTYKYTEERAKLSVPPYFPEASSIKVDGITDSSVKISFPSALSRGFDENSFVAYYKLDVYDAKSEKLLKSVKIISDFFVKNKRDVYSWGLFEIPNSPKWRITVTPVSTWYVEGAPISVIVTPNEPEFPTVDFDEDNIFEVAADNIGAEHISGDYSRKDNGIYIVPDGICTVGYTFKVEKAGTYRIFVNASAKKPVEVTMTASIGNNYLCSKTVTLDTGSYTDGFYVACADVKIDAPGKYTIKFNKSKAPTSIRLYGIKLARHLDTH